MIAAQHRTGHRTPTSSNLHSLICPHKQFAKSQPGLVEELLMSVRSLVQLVRFLVVQLIHSGLNFRFDMGIIFTVIIFSVRDDVPVDSETFLVTDFVNLKIKPAQYFRCAHKSMVCIRVFIGVSVFVLCFLKKDDKAEKYNTVIPALDCRPDLLNTNIFISFSRGLDRVWIWTTVMLFFMAMFNAALVLNRFTRFAGELFGMWIDHHSVHAGSSRGTQFTICKI
jgi:hypothetical protein